MALVQLAALLAVLAPVTLAVQSVPNPAMATCDISTIKNIDPSRDVLSGDWYLSRTTLTYADGVSLNDVINVRPGVIKEGKFGKEVHFLNFEMMVSFNGADDAPKCQRQTGLYEKLENNVYSGSYYPIAYPDIWYITAGWEDLYVLSTDYNSTLVTFFGPVTNNEINVTSSNVNIYTRDVTMNPDPTIVSLGFTQFCAADFGDPDSDVYSVVENQGISDCFNTAPAAADDDNNDDEEKK